MEKVIFKNLTNVKFQQLKNAIGKDKLRPQLSGVFLDVENQKIVVTNGFVLVAYDIEIVEATEDEKILRDVIIDPKIFNQQTWLSVPKEDAEFVQFHVTEEKTEVYLDEELVAISNNIPHEVKFPNWFHILNNSDFRSEISIDANVLKSAMSAIPNDFTPPNFQFGKKVKFTSKGVFVDEEIERQCFVVGLIMPINFGEDAIFNRSEVVEVGENLIGRKTSQRVIRSWNEQFVDEDTAEVIDIERNEIVLDRDTEIGQDEVALLLENGIQKIFVHKI